MDEVNYKQIKELIDYFMEGLKEVMKEYLEFKGEI